LTLSKRRGAIDHFARGAKRQLLWILIAYGIGASGTWYYREEIFSLLLAPARGMLSPAGSPVFVAPTEMFSATVHLSLMGGLVAALPVISVGFFRLLIPLLPAGGRRFAIFFFPAVGLSYLAGASFAYLVLLPAGLSFLLSFGTNIATPMIRISEYMSLVTAMVIWLGLLFELPLVMFLMARLRLVSHTRWKTYRKFVPVTAFILAAIITPTFDIINQVLVAIPLIVLFEIGLFLSWVGRPTDGKRWGALWIVLTEAVFLSVLIAAVVALLFYAGVLGGVR
jgi:sec-independent protein translocase protein TatC|tara:strand:- start:216 stop:1058 length:843 start_codon:yes stop_codon:yes gene_type:complete